MDDTYYQKAADALDNMGYKFLRPDAHESQIIVYKSKGGITEYVTHINLIFHDNQFLLFKIGKN
jgi:hypothetical protein